MATQKWQRTKAREAIKAVMEKAGDGAGISKDEARKLATEVVGRELTGEEFGQIMFAGFRRDPALDRYFRAGYHPIEVRQKRAKAKKAKANKAKPPQLKIGPDPAFDLTGEYTVEVEGAGVNLQGLKVRRVIIWLAALTAFAMVAIAIT